MAKQIALVGKIGPAFGGVKLISWGAISTNSYDANAVNVAFEAMADNIAQGISYAEWSGQPGPAVNLWGTEKALINSDEFCPECEREVPSHYESCPLHHRNVNG